MDDELDKSVVSMSDVLHLITELWLHKRLSLLLGNILKYCGVKGHQVPTYCQMGQKENIWRWRE